VTHIESSATSISVSFETTSSNEFECILDSSNNITLIIKEKSKTSTSSRVERRFKTENVICVENNNLLPVEYYNLEIQTECITNQTEYPSIITSNPPVFGLF
jgi:hypothetical protein